MTLQQIKYFLAVAKHQQFASAAKTLYITPPSLTYSIRELEHELGVPLFVRNSNKKVLLTEYGQKYLPYAEKIFAILEEGDSVLKSMNDPLSGTVKLGFFYCVSNTEIPEIFRHFYQDNPNCDIFLDFSVNQGSGLIDDQLLLGTYDMVVTTSSEVKDCVAEKIGVQKLVALVADINPLASKDSVTVEELVENPVLAINPGSNLDNWLRNMFAEYKLKPEISYCPDWMTQFGYVAMDYGVAVTPSMPLYSGYTKELELLADDWIWRDLYLVWPKKRSLTKSAKYVRDYILDYTKTHKL